MRCHYEVLGLPREAGDEELRKAYRRLALRWHPDKNLENPEEAAEQFKLIQAAYDVLSDPQERAWYDNHREAILKGGLDGEFEDDSLDLLQFFTSACYSGYTDDQGGFYAVYRHVFDTIAEEEVEGAPNPQGLLFPSFGHSQSDYQTVVHPFYAHWQSFYTQRTMAWRERFDTRQAVNRGEKRAMERENRRLRDKARKELSQVVRQLVAFVRRRDPRVQAHRQRLQELNAQRERRAQELQREQVLQQARLAEQYEEQHWVTLSDLERELQQMEEQYQKEFGDRSDDEQEGPEEDGDGGPGTDSAEDEGLFCPACERTFQTAKAMRNHEKSKKHREMVALLRQQLQAEELQLRAAQESQEPPTEQPRPSKKHKRKKQQKVLDPTDFRTPGASDSRSESEAESGEEHERCQDSGEDNLPTAGISHTAEREGTEGGVSKEAEDTGHQEMVRTPSPAAPEPAPRVSKTKGKKGKQQKHLGRRQESDPLNCVICNCPFSSRNKLFEHLRATGHAAAVPDQRAAGSRTSSGRRKNR
ncbi:dnaJ homolog subfamily C member 21 isoform X1 [Hypanus sabinus]|uniref:dnaJ homolog subfamily C member 21 isoform X1 n=1 Tax=Hypanus sabinus TaxID=79690 RepID=UPI0028C49E6C|nr:dnaJ homolog subfamily C member 21 isoform X1 [Hypanus sabinus]